MSTWIILLLLLDIASVLSNELTLHIREDLSDLFPHHLQSIHQAKQLVHQLSFSVYIKDNSTVSANTTLFHQVIFPQIVVSDARGHIHPYRLCWLTVDSILDWIKQLYYRGQVIRGEFSPSKTFRMVQGSGINAYDRFAHLAQAYPDDQYFTWIKGDVYQLRIVHGDQVLVTFTENSTNAEIANALSSRNDFSHIVEVTVSTLPEYIHQAARILWIIATPEQFQKYITTWVQIDKSLKVVFLPTVDYFAQSIPAHFGVISSYEMPIWVYVESPHNIFAHYSTHKDYIVPTTIQRFLRSIEYGEWPLHYRAQPPFGLHTAEVLKHYSFFDLQSYLKSAEQFDLLVILYAPYDWSSQILLDRVSTIAKDISTTAIAPLIKLSLVDGTLNDIRSLHKEFQTSQYPAIYYIAKDSKYSIQQYMGPASLVSLWMFIMERASPDILVESFYPFVIQLIEIT